MSDDFGKQLPSHGNRWFSVGCAVEIASGALGGMTGVLVGFRRGRNCLIRLDGVEKGVLLEIDAAALEERPPGLAANSAGPVRAAPLRRRNTVFGFTRG